ncbi:MAG TPA: Sec-independent protein translocase protein TatB [Methylomirabilota bacterium]|jgi:TatA/E family protein of Tat protein translocase|nr:Sec-independent protein translocase protein TatB [Methylomirabilota bacterium]
MLDIGFQELLVLLVIALVVFGPHKLPELGRALGRAMREFRRASDEFRQTVETNLNLNDDSSILPPSASSSVSATEPETPPATPTTPAEPEAAPPGLDGIPPAPAEPFCGRRGGRLLHRSSCAWVARIPEPERSVYKTAAEALELGLAACPVCTPRDEAAPL